jgi:hypothetical protein
MLNLAKRIVLLIDRLALRQGRAAQTATQIVVVALAACLSLCTGRVSALHDGYEGPLTGPALVAQLDSPGTRS